VYKITPLQLESTLLYSKKQPEIYLSVVMRYFYFVTVQVWLSAAVSITKLRIVLLTR